MARSHNSQKDPLDEESDLDPFSTRDVLRWWDREKGRGRVQVDLIPLHAWLEVLKLPREHRHAKMFIACAGILLGIKTGEIDLKDEEGRCKLGDLMTEMADYLYAHVEEVEGGPQKG